MLTPEVVQMLWRNKGNWSSYANVAAAVVLRA